MNTFKTDNYSKLLSSYALFKEFFDRGEDVYGIISKFLQATISAHGYHVFTLNEVVQALNSDFEFDIPSAIVKTSLKRIENLKKTGAQYIISNPSDFNSIDFNTVEQVRQKESTNIIEEFINYFEDLNKKTLNNEEKISLMHSFCNYIQDVQNGDNNLEYISSFILKNKDIDRFKDQINHIREGVILYSGIKFNNNLNDFGAWRSDLIIYVETEILFNLAGYNGELYKDLVIELLEFVSEINQKAGKKRIKLKYFPEVRYEIEGFFKKATYIFNGDQIINPSVTAMASIINGCKMLSDINDKKADFYHLLKSKHIEEDDYDKYYSAENHKYNITNQEIIDKVSKDLAIDATSYIKTLNFVAISRGESNDNNFENIKAILLSGNANTLRVAWHESLKKDGVVPLATTMDFLTNKFWFRLHKGFGKSSLPKSFDIISKSQIILSTVLNKKIGDEYKVLQEQVTNGCLTEEQIKSRLISLRNETKKPEEILHENVEDILLVITEDSLSKFIEEQSLAKINAEKKEQENERLRVELLETKDKADNMVQDSQKENFKDLVGIKKNLDGKIESQYKAYKFLMIISYIVLIAIIYPICHYYENFYTYITSVLPVLIVTVYFICAEKEINPMNAIRKHLNTRKENIAKKIYKAFNFNIERYQTLENLIVNRKDELNN